MTQTHAGDGASPTETAERAQSTSLAISNEMVRLYKARFGRGPTKTWTHWAGPDVVAVILEDTLTPVERSLVAMGEHQRLRRYRGWRRLSRDVLPTPRGL